MTTKIQWTDETWNPIRALRRQTNELGHRDDLVGWHCERVSQGCENCYAETLNQRQRFGNGTGLGYTRPSRDKVELVLDEATLTKPLRWQKPRRVFVCSMTDLFGEWVPDEFMDRVFAVMALTPHITYQVLTKRPERMREYLSLEDLDCYTRVDEWASAISGESGVGVITAWPLPNVWLGTSVEDQRAADERIPVLLDTPAAVRFVSCEPLLGPVAIEPWLLPVPTIGGGWRMTGGSALDIADRVLDWVIVGGESGPGARPCNIEWVRSLVRQCQASDVPVFVKQLGSRPLFHRDELPAGRRAAAYGGQGDARFEVRLRHSHGGDPEEWPEDLRVREFPDAR